MTAAEYLAKLRAESIASATPERLVVEAKPLENNASPAQFSSSDRLTKFQERQAQSQAFQKREIKENANQSSVIT
jgi:hypothetical protein